MKRIIYYLALAMLVLTSCDKEELSITEPTASTKKDILTFATQEDFDKTLAKINAMSKEQRLAWEKEQGFKSFGTICDEFYETLNPLNYSNIEQVQKLTNINLLSVYEEDGNFFIEPKYIKEPRRNLMNNEMMYLIKDKVVKIFDEGDVYTSIININTLRNINNYQNANDALCVNNGLMKITKIDENTSKVKMIRDFSENKKFMLRLHVGLWQYYAMFGFDGARREIFCIIQNYERVLGIYWITGLPTKVYTKISANGANGLLQSINLDGTFLIRSSLDNDIQTIGTIDSSSGGWSYSGSDFSYWIEKFEVDIDNLQVGDWNCKIKM